MTILINLDEGYRAAVASGVHHTNYILMVIPKGVEMSQFNTLRQADGLGAIVIEHASGPP